MSESSLVTKKWWANKANYEVGRSGYKIKGIVIHHAASTSLNSIGTVFSQASRGASAHYGVGGKEIHQYVSEANTAWHCGNWYGNHATVGIETTNSTGAPDWKVSDQTLDTLIKLVADIAKRNNLGKLWLDPKADYPTLSGHKDWYGSATACVPLDETELLTPSGFKRLESITKDDLVAQWNSETGDIDFVHPLGVIEPYEAEVIKRRWTEATANHRMYIRQNVHGKLTDKYIVREWGEIPRDVSLPTGGHFSGNGLPISSDELELLVWIQADGHYMKDGECHYGIEFHFVKQRKIDRVRGILDDLAIPYKFVAKKDGTATIRIYGKQYYEWAETYLKDKEFTWDWLNMSDEQFDRFNEAIYLADGCVMNSSYSSSSQNNIDVVQAILFLHGQSSHVYDDARAPRLYARAHTYHINKRAGEQTRTTTVSCVTVPTGAIVIRQYGKIQIVGNCPGPYLYPKLQYIADKANAINYPPEPAEPTAPVWKDVKAQTYETAKAANLYNILTGATVASYKKGTSIGIVQTTTWKGVEYGRTEWSRDRKLNNGFKMSEMVIPTPAPEPTPEPTPTPEPEPTPEPTPEDPTVGILQKIIDFIKHIIELITKKQGE